ncbi:PDZ domain-containing protein [Clostridium tyrobutyricum]|uniref:PDZ domain-containing protein n=1 Tax=Clostridium tyrobutyricum TaxID=1519 RepID=UPI0002EEC689|nr:PDZ domain-containing protein [Clostridium tyrobutyricum]MBV4431769.1 PDZ domain-containing protein [Clostridium tyrobutyricum]MBV4449158.1 PDZ domain-containing protein [Clostridium tyrobutyricum]MCH4236663.1 PDZ domain-containing protein [Clostridium tyrobutyricum]MCH4257956.1 PDZ domain-containing protein [Clostridium tyrobutyricum]MCI1238994.1 PDZ domain-containing protein [Clostridium tyrobutyricum]
MNMLVYTLKAIAYALTNFYFIVLLAILAFVLYRKNSKIVLMQKMIIGEKINTTLELTISQIVIGIFAGTLASVIMSYLGITFNNNSSVELIFLASIVFMFFNPRFICFSYSGALIGFISILLNIVSMHFNMSGLDFLKIDIVSLMSMVAILHFVEGILVVIDGKKGSIPVFTNKSGRIVGGFALQRYWLIPIAIFFILQSKPDTASYVQLYTPNWWPILKNQITNVNLLKTAVLTLMPFYAVIGYSSVTFTKNVKEKTFMSGMFIIVYSVLLFVLAQFANINLFLKLFVIVFAPLAHEGMIFIQRYIETVGKPKYISSDEGIMVLAVAPNSPANEMGIKSGDLLVEINSQKIENEEKITEIARKCSNFIWFKIKRVTGKLEQVSYNKMNENRRLGIVFVPRNVPKDSTIIKLNKDKFSDVLNKVKNKNKDKDD